MIETSNFPAFVNEKAAVVVFLDRSTTGTLSSPSEISFLIKGKEPYSWFHKGGG